MSLSETRLGANATGLPGPTILPPLAAALSRRAALFGAVTMAGVTAAALPTAEGVLSSEQTRGGVLENEETLEGLPRFGDTPTDADRRLALAAGVLDALQAKADRHAAGAGSDPADPYTQTVAEMDLVAAGMAALPADSMAGVMTKLRAMRVPIVRDDDEAHGLAVSVCRDLRRLQATGALS